MNREGENREGERNCSGSTGDVVLTEVHTILSQGRNRGKCCNFPKAESENHPCLTRWFYQLAFTTNTMHRTISRSQNGQGWEGPAAPTPDFHSEVLCHHAVASCQVPVHEFLGVQVGHAVGDLRGHLDHLPQRRRRPPGVILPGKVTVTERCGLGVTLNIIQFPAVSRELCSTLPTWPWTLQLLCATCARPCPPSQPRMSSQNHINSTPF